MPSQSSQKKSSLESGTWQWLTPVLLVQLAWVALSALWNISGVMLIKQGLRAPGPTASMLGAAALLAIGVGLVIGLRRWPIVYVVLSALTGAMAIAAVANAFAADPALWPSEFWRYAGAVLNSIGALAAISALVGFVKSKFNSGQHS